MIRPALITASAILLCAHASASPLCVSALLPAFIAETSAGCMIGPALVAGMYTSDLADGSSVKAIPTDNILVTPTSSGLSFAVNARAVVFTYQVIVSFQLSAPAVSGASVTIYGTPFESGAVYGMEYICNGAPFDPPAFHGDIAWDGCAQNGGTSASFSAVIQNSSFGPPPPSATTSIDLTPTTFIGVVTLINVGGNAAAGAQLSGFSDDFSIQSSAIPEPCSALLLLAGLCGVGCVVRARSVSNAA
jgi:hypothetical protein